MLDPYSVRRFTRIPRRSIPFLCIAAALAIGCSKKTAPAPSVANELAETPAPSPAPAATPAPEAKSWVQTARETGSGMATGRRQYSPLLIVKHVDKASQ